MPHNTLISKSEQRIHDMERSLSLKQLQINRLLNITQAINENVSADALFEMYASFLNWEIGIRKMALYFKREDKWTLASSIGIEAAAFIHDPSAIFSKFDGLQRLDEATDPLLREFSVVIPVLHKEIALAYVFLGDIDDSSEMYNRVQFVTTITNVIAVAIENKRLFKQQLEQERYKAELAMATDIQRSLIPDSLPRTVDYDLAALYIPRFGVGGDFYSAERFADGKLLFCIADITGKGTGAALLMSNFEASFWTLAQSRKDLSSFVRDLNKALYRVTRGERFVTLFIGEFCPETRTLHYVNAGHNPPLMMCASGDTTPQELTEGCTFLGAFETLPAFPVGHHDVSCGGILLCYTDGVTELTDSNGQMYGEENLYSLAAKAPHDTAEGFNQHLLSELGTFQGDTESTDDLTVLTVLFH